LTIALLFTAGLVALIGGAELLVRGASRLAFSLGLSPLVVGLTVVAFGTSAPEVAVSIGAAWSGQADIAIGNSVGSNIFNVLFILGIAAIITPLVVARQVIRQEVPIMVCAFFFIAVLAMDGRLSRFDGFACIVLLGLYMLFLVLQSRREASVNGRDEAPPEASGWTSRLPFQLALIAAGLALLVLGSTWLVDAAVSIARIFGLSELVIGLTIISAGTSLPEVAASIMAALRGQRDMAVGNVVGSNIFNVLGVLGVGALVAPDALPVAQSVLNFDLPIMLAIGVACLPIFFTGNVVARWEGALFLAYYLAYTSYLLLRAQEHDALDTFRFAMGAFVLPLTVITLLLIS
jgi:cation:H+ antiporter